MKRVLALVLLMCAPLWSCAQEDAQEDRYTLGENYRALSAPLTTNAAEGKVEVVEFFWYGCPHCYDFEPYVEEWQKEKSDNIEFVRVPAIFRPGWKVHAQAFYTAEMLGVSDKIHRPLLDAMHKHKRQFGDAAAMRAFFLEQGVSGDDFDKTFESFMVMSKVARAEQLTRKSGIRGVPAMVIDGRYQPIAHSFNDMIRVTDYLAHEALAKAKD